MAEPQIRYARTDDGVSIAYTTMGDGPPVLYCPTHFLSMQQLFSNTNPTAWLRLLVARTRLTVFDHAGIGASQHEVGDFSFGAQLREIEAVAARMPDGPFTLIGFGAGSASAALYATRHPERVRELVCLYPAPSIVTGRLAATMREDWSLARRRLAGWAYPDSIPTQRWFGNAMRESMTPEVAAAYCEEFARTDLRDTYRRIPVRTLFCVTPEGQDRTVALALASLVPDCRVKIVSDLGDGVATAVFEFMGLDTAGVEPPSAPSGDAHGTAVILFTDIADSTSLTERLGDAAFRDASRQLDVRLRTAIADAGGSAVDGKLLGDGVMAIFSSARQAIDAALACGELSAASELLMHIGLHAGDVISEGANVYGGAVNIASRVCALSAPGEILVSQTVRDLARTSAGVAFEDRGEHALKGIDDPVRLYAVRPTSNIEPPTPRR
jgi:class 3 adenylate cyclase